MPGTLAKLLAYLYFMFARYFVRKGSPIGMWFQNKGILLLTGLRRKRD